MSYISAFIETVLSVITYQWIQIFTSEMCIKQQKNYVQSLKCYSEQKLITNNVPGIQETKFINALRLRK